MADRTGQQLGNYRVIRPIGRGGFAEVYLGEHIFLKTQVAIKVLQTKVANDEDLEGFLKEAQTIAHLVHPQIVRVMDFGVDAETPFLVMDYAPNGTLR
jgi:serine/threonine protein kinase